MEKRSNEAVATVHHEADASSLSFLAETDTFTRSNFLALKEPPPPLVALHQTVATAAAADAAAASLEFAT